MRSKPFKVIKSWVRQLKRRGNSYYINLPPRCADVIMLVSGRGRARILLTDQGIWIVPEAEK